MSRWDGNPIIDAGDSPNHFFSFDGYSLEYGLSSQLHLDTLGDVCVEIHCLGAVPHVVPAKSIRSGNFLVYYRGRGVQHKPA